MSGARDNMMALVARVSAGIADDWCNEVRAHMDAYAHELAEKQRTELDSGTVFLRVRNPVAPYEVAHTLAAHLIDLIDPEVST